MRPRRAPPRESGLDRSQHSADQAQESLPEFLRSGFLWFLRHGFDNNTALIACTFEVSPETARLWINGVSLPRAETLYGMLMCYPDFAHRVGIVVDFPAPPPGLQRHRGRRAA